MSQLFSLRSSCDMKKVEETIFSPSSLFPELAVLLEGHGTPQPHSTALLKHFLQQNKGIIHYGKLLACSHYCRVFFWFLKTRVSQALGGSAESSAPTFPLFLLHIYRDTGWIPCSFTPRLLWNPPMLEKVLSVKFSIRSSNPCIFLQALRHLLLYSIKEPILKVCSEVKISLNYYLLPNMRHLIFFFSPQRQ